MQNLIHELKQVYSALSLDTIDQLIPLYRDDVTFIDPVNCIKGRDNVLDHFRASYKDVISCTFDFDSSKELAQDNKVFLSWTMRYQHKSLKSGKPIELDGASLLKFDEEIFFHQDWFDLGAMVYENVPLIGSLVRVVKSKLRA